MTFKVLTVSTAFLWFFHRGSCLSYFFTWLGDPPMYVPTLFVRFHTSTKAVRELCCMSLPARPEAAC